jgi:hypothetical protein
MNSVKDFENLMLQLQIQFVIWTAVSLIISIVILYWVIRKAVAHGIEDSGLIGSWSRSVAAAELAAQSRAVLPEMRAER